ncbi:hypothetical protein LOY34_17260 [Pseudomonas sp. B21-009]|uniref:hypothetical protein n=1 Tax=Pseudomonas sp. B21-009 TaxID=2895470 RepID=UPI002160359B|nr:hypothetical protein [Pseudomonas sp. B21-009]UVM65082.1 hypothetical protein LOY34_17260 [Pseudomonas sp. B21-009]
MSEQAEVHSAQTLASGGIGRKPPKAGPTSSGRPTEALGTLTEKMGTGENAKNSIVWMTITWSFSIATAISFLFFSLVVCYKDFSYLESIKSVWSLFIPLITLALGYAFGKSK